MPPTAVNRSFPLSPPASVDDYWPTKWAHMHQINQSIQYHALQMPNEAIKLARSVPRRPSGAVGASNPAARRKRRRSFACSLGIMCRRSALQSAVFCCLAMKQAPRSGSSTSDRAITAAEHGRQTERQRKKNQTKKQSRHSCVSERSATSISRRQRNT